MRAAALLVALCLCAPARAAPEEDYRPDSSAWNGLSRFLAEATAAGCAVSPATTLDWARLGPRDVLFFVYPLSPVDPDALGDFLSRGGRALLADDFGAAGPALDALQLHRGAARLEGVLREPGHPELPVARVALLTALGRSTPRLVTNHPAVFETSLPATFALSPAQAIVVEGGVGRGHFIALADPSVLINNMMELEGNAAFARGLLGELCLPGADGDRVHLFTGAFRAVTPQAHPTAPRAGLGRFNDLLATQNRAIEELLRGWFALPISFVLCGAALALAWRPLARVRAIGHGDGRFVRAEGVGPRGAFAIVDAIPTEGLADHALPLQLLRIELMRRLSLAVGALPATAPRRERLRRIGVALGPAVRDAYARFLAIGPDPDAPPAGRPVRRRTFARAMDTARAVLAAAGPSAPSQGA